MAIRISYNVLFSIVLLLGIGCDRNTPTINQAETPLMEIPKGFPAMPEPADNSFTYDRWLLGKQLFYDTRLSINNTISCGSCHQSDLAFSDSLAFSLGVKNAVGTRNAPTLANIGYHPYFNRDGGVPTIEMQILVPIQEHNEFNNNILDIVALLSTDSHYVLQAEQCYDRPFDAFVLTRAIAVFERSLISGNSRYDTYINGDATAFNESEKRGYELFNSERTNCASCHSDFNFTNYAFENNGLYETYTDTGRMRITHQEIDRAKFKVPTLRNIALTAPYMHDGSFQTLAEVVQHYNTGGKNHSNKNPLIRPLYLSEQEQQDLINFLKSLTDLKFVNNKNFKNEQ